MPAPASGGDGQRTGDHAGAVDADSGEPAPAGVRKRHRGCGQHGRLDSDRRVGLERAPEGACHCPGALAALDAEPERRLLPREGERLTPDARDEGGEQTPAPAWSARRRRGSPAPRRAAAAQAPRRRRTGPGHEEKAVARIPPEEPPPRRPQAADRRARGRTRCRRAAGPGLPGAARSPARGSRNAARPAIAPAARPGHGKEREEERDAGGEPGGEHRARRPLERRAAARRPAGRRR